MNTKKCSRCKNVYPATSTYFRTANGQIRTPCKKCRAEEKRLYTEKVRQQRPTVDKTIKKCRKCGQVFPNIHDHFYEGRATCKTCISDNSKQKYRETGKLKPPVDRSHRTCARCQKTFPSTEEHFSLRYINKSGEQLFHSYCHLCAKEKRKEKYVETKTLNPESIRRASHNYYYNNREKAIKRACQWAKDNAHRMNERRRLHLKNSPALLEKKRKERKEWNLAHPEQQRSRVAKYKAMKKQAFPSWSNLDLIKELYREASYLTRVTTTKYSVDHIDPLQSPLICGLHVPENLRVVPIQQNFVKSNTFVPYRIDADGNYYKLKGERWIISNEAFTFCAVEVNSLSDLFFTATN